MTDRQIARLLLVLAFGTVVSGLLWDIREVSCVGLALTIAALTWRACVWGDSRRKPVGRLAEYRAQVMDPQVRE